MRGRAAGALRHCHPHREWQVPLATEKSQDKKSIIFVDIPWNFARIAEIPGNYRKSVHFDEMLRKHYYSPKMLEMFCKWLAAKKIVGRYVAKKRSPLSSQEFPNKQPRCGPPCSILCSAHRHSAVRKSVGFRSAATKPILPFFFLQFSQGEQRAEMRGYRSQHRPSDGFKAMRGAAKPSPDRL